MKQDSLIDLDLSAVQEVVQSLTHFQASLEAEDLLKMRIERLKVSTPIELDVYHHPNGRLVLGSAPPVYTLPTTDAPVLHQLTLTIAKLDEPQ